MLIDAHCHLHDREFFTETEAEEALGHAHKNSVERIICIGTSVDDSYAAHDFAKKHDNVFWTFGIHPNEVNTDADFYKTLMNLMNTTTDTTVATRLVGIGEIGLDYHFDGYNRENQIRLFRALLKLASDNGLPVSFHIREAFDDFFDIIKDYPDVRGVVHSFSDNKKNLRKILETTSLYVGVNGLATYSTLPLPPLDRIILETDAPFLAPVPHKNEKNEPTFVCDVAKWLAEKTETSLDEVASKTCDNVNKLFRI